VPLGEVVHGEGSRVQAMVFAGDDLVAAERDGDVWSTRVGADGKGTGQRWRVAPGGTFPEALAVSPDGTQVAIAVSQRASVDEDTGTLHGVTVLDVQTGRQVRRVATAARTQGLSWTAGGLFARVEGDKLVNVGSSAATPLATLTTATAVTADGSAAIGCDNAGTCRWLRLTDGQVLAEAQALSFRAASVALSPDGAYWAAGSFGGEIVVGRATEARPVVAVRHGDSRGARGVVARRQDAAVGLGRHHRHAVGRRAARPRSRALRSRGRPRAPRRAAARVSLPRATPSDLHRLAQRVR
jgi:hypothetical protein